MKYNNRLYLTIGVLGLIMILVGFFLGITWQKYHDYHIAIKTKKELVIQEKWNYLRKFSEDNLSEIRRIEVNIADLKDVVNSHGKRIAEFEKFVKPHN